MNLMKKFSDKDKNIQRLVEILDLKRIPVEELVLVYEPSDLAILLLIEPETTDTDILLENLLVYFVTEEKFEYACIIRDEIKRRNPLI